jgi:uncharacterized membrane protein YukC
MLFSLPIGIYLLLKQKKNQERYEAVFYDFYQKVLEDKDLDRDEKRDLLLRMLEQNGYEVSSDSKRITGVKKIFSIPWMMIGIGLLYVGLLVYVIYYLYFQKPHRVEFDLKNI